jgi:hypothetical protein
MQKSFNETTNKTNILQLKIKKPMNNSPALKEIIL